MRPTAIADLMYDADYNPAMRAAVPWAVRAALGRRRGAACCACSRCRRSTPRRRARRTSPPPATRPSARRRRCRGRAGRRWPTASRVARQRALELPPSAFHPFDAEVAYADEIDLCLRWPDPGRPPHATGGAYPAVPTLLLQGEEDLRTPPEASARIASLIPGAQRVTVPGVGHAIIGGDPSGCGRRQLLRFVAGKSVRARCPRVPTGVPDTAVPPASFGAVVPAEGIGGRAGRTVEAIDATLDFLDLALSPAIDFQRPRRRAARRELPAHGRRLTLDDVVVVPGVRVSGRERRGGALRLRVRGSAAARGTRRGEPARAALRPAGRAARPRAARQRAAEPAGVRHRDGGADGDDGHAAARTAVAAQRLTVDMSG